MAWVPVIDVSEWQRPINWPVMYAMGVRHVIIRAGINGRYDVALDDFVNGARAAGIVVVALYWFINPRSSASAVQQAGLLVAACQKYNVLTPMYDSENYASETNDYDRQGHKIMVILHEEYAAWLRTMSDAVAAHTGPARIVYTGASFWNTYVGVDTFGDHDLILATYPGENDRLQRDLVPNGVAPVDWSTAAFRALSGGPNMATGWHSWDGWQFSAGYNHQAPVYGAHGSDLDLNIVHSESVDHWLTPGSGPVVGPNPPLVSNPEGKVLVQVAPVMDNGARPYARFVCEMVQTPDGQWFGMGQWWIDGGVASWLDQHTVEHVEFTEAQMRQVPLTGRVPTGDGAYDWSAFPFNRPS